MFASNKKNSPRQLTETVEKQALAYLQEAKCIPAGINLSKCKIRIPYPPQSWSLEFILLINDVNSSLLGHIFMRPDNEPAKNRVKPTQIQAKSYIYLGTIDAQEFSYLKKLPKANLLVCNHLDQEGLTPIKLKRPLYFMSIESSKEIRVALIKENKDLDEVQEAIESLRCPSTSSTFVTLDGKKIDAYPKSLLLNNVEGKTLVDFFSWQNHDYDSQMGSPILGWTRRPLSWSKSGRTFKWKLHSREKKFNLNEGVGLDLLNPTVRMYMERTTKELTNALIEPLALSL